MELDETDLKLIELLKKDSRVSYTDLGKQLGLSDVAIKKRVDKLISSEVIKNFSINVNNKKIGLKIKAFLLINCAPGEIPKVRDKFKKLTQTQAIHNSIGEYDLMIEILCKDIDSLKELIENKFSSMKGINQLNTLIVL